MYCGKEIVLTKIRLKDVNLINISYDLSLSLSFPFIIDKNRTE